MTDSTKNLRRRWTWHVKVRRVCTVYIQVHIRQENAISGWNIKWASAYLFLLLDRFKDYWRWEG